MGNFIQVPISEETFGKVNDQNFKLLVSRISQFVENNFGSLVTNEDQLKEAFDRARINFPGSKRGLDTEFNNLKKKHKDWYAVIPLLEHAVKNQILSREIKKQKNEFVAPWKNFPTWINNRSWEDQENVIMETKIKRSISIEEYNKMFNS
jgi:hypothetical protein